MDACIINKQCHVFRFNDLLSAYIANHSTVNVFLLLMKAFDKVHLLFLFNKLRLKAMCSLLLRFIINMYIRQNI